jgi:hypothetical protein
MASPKPTDQGIREPAISYAFYYLSLTGATHLIDFDIPLYNIW